jgi:YHS domain-containing protein
MIALLALTGGFVVRGPLIAAARRRLQAGAGVDGHDHHAESAVISASWSKRLRSKAGWSGAAGFTMADIAMLRRELVIGYGVAGFLAVLVPAHVWNDVFLSGHGFWTTLENAVVGPFIACISFVCSIGNVPMAAALWHGGISFGGVVSFIFADLIALPLLLIYRKYYGGRLALRLFLWFYVVMAVAGMITEGLFDVAGLIPRTRPRTIVATHFAWNYTTVLNIAAIAVFGLLLWLAHNRARFGGGSGYATDPVCGMQVELATAPARATHRGTTYHFCSDRCRERFETDRATR